MTPTAEPGPEPRPDPERPSSERPSSERPSSEGPDSEGPDERKPGRRKPRSKAERLAAVRRESTNPGEGFNIMGTLLSGIVFWGLVGFGLDRLVGTDVLFLPIGVLLGLAAGLYLVIYRLRR